MNMSKQFPRWIRQSITIIGVAIGAWYILGGWLAWAFQLSGMG